MVLAGTIFAQKKEKSTQLIEKGKQLYNEGKYNQAIKALLQSVNKIPNSEAFLYIGKCCFQMKDTCTGCKYLSSAFKQGATDDVNEYFNQVCFHRTRIHDTVSYVQQRFLEYSYSIIEYSPCLNMSYQKMYDSSGNILDSVCIIMPEFYGGDEARNQFLAKYIIYPKNATENGIQGTVYVSFIVDSNGKISEIKILSGIGGGCDEEVIRVVKLMPKWKPGTANGKPVKIIFHMPVYFKLQG